MNKGAWVPTMNHATLRNSLVVAPMIYTVIGLLTAQNFNGKQLTGPRDTQERFRTASLSPDPTAMVIENDCFARS